MNKSGEAVRELMRYYKISTLDLILIYDDIDLETGQLRIRTKGGCGGHRGCVSVVSTIGTDEFKRVRIGIGRPVFGMDVVDYVLSDFSPSEALVIENSIESATDSIRMILNNDLSGAMSKYNLRGE
jgi:peptidyl-tRNA hydrolase, PTH1 family